MNIFSQATTVLYGLIAGGMLLIATGLVPYWLALDTEEFTKVFGTSLPTVGGTMIVLTILSTGSIVLTAGLALWKKQPGRVWFAAAAVASLVMLVCVPFYFGAANAALSGGTLSPEAITAERLTWQQMHWFRTIVGILGLFCAIRAGYAAEKSS